MQAAFRKLLLLVAGGVIGCLLAEVLLRLLGVSFPLPYYPDEYAGWRLQPGFSAWFTREGRALVEVNQEGFRDADHAPRKPPDTVRIAVLGDSYAEAAQVELSETFWSVLGQRLQACPALVGKKIEVLNFSASGYGTAQELQVLRHRVWKYAPDIVLVAFLSGNDLRNNSVRLEMERVRPFFVLEQGEWKLDESFRQHPDFLKSQSRWTRAKVALINGSRLLQLVHEIRSRRGQAAMPESAADAEIGLNDLCFVEPRNDDWEQAWQVTERLLAEMAAECRQHGADFWVATITNPIQVDPDPKLREAYRARLAVPDLFYAERRIEQLGVRERFPVVLLGPLMGEQAEKQQRYWHGFANTKFGTGHWNLEGHRLAGEIIAEAICRQLVKTKLW